MRVFLATQILSHTVVAGMLTYTALGKLADEATHTAEFAEAVDGMFDYFKSQELCDKKALHRPITDNSQSRRFNECAQLVHTVHTAAMLRLSLSVAGSKFLPIPAALVVLHI